MHIFLLAVLGLVAGSFISAWTHRLHGGGTVWRGRSACPGCGHTLVWYDLIPIFSWLFLRGRCRYCGQPISWQYPLLEVAMASLLVMAVIGSQPLAGWELWWYVLATAVLVAASVYDLRWMELPDATSIVLGVIGVGRIMSGGEGWLAALIGAAVAAGFFALQYVLSRGKWIGTGDIVLGAAIGLLLGWPAILLAMIVAYVTGSLVAVVLLMGRRRGWQSAVPFGPFLALGGLVAWRFGPPIMDILGWI